MKLCLLFHTWSRWERRYDCKFERYCKVDGCNAEDFTYEHVWGRWFYETSGSCKVLRKCHRCDEIESGADRHEWTDWKYKKSSDCDVFRICSRCGQAESDLAHSWGNWEYKSENDCSQIRVCERCESKEQGWERHEWEKVGLFKWICKRCNKKKSIKNHIIPIKWRSKKIKGITPNSKKMKLEEHRRLEIIEDIIRGEGLERQREQERIKNHQSQLRLI